MTIHNNPPRVIGIIGKAGTGKDTLADHFTAAGYTKLSLADPLKKISGMMFNIPENNLWGPSQNRTPFTRKVLQTLGTDIARKLDPDVWVNLCLSRVYSFFASQPDPFNCYKVQENPMGVVIPDVRFPNEARELVTQHGALLIKINRIIELKPLHQHASETSSSQIPEELIDYTINNNGTLQELAKMFQHIAETENVCTDIQNTNQGRTTG